VISQIIKSTKIKKRGNANTNRNINSTRNATLNQNLDDVDKKIQCECPVDSKSNKNKKRIFRPLKALNLFGHKQEDSKIKKNKLLMILGSLIISIFIWMYIQITINPVETKSFTIPVSIEGVSELRSNNLDLTNISSSVNIVIKGRSKNLNSLSINDLKASIDLSNINSVGRKSIDISIDVKKIAYFRTENLYPNSIMVEIFEYSNSTNK